MKRCVSLVSLLLMLAASLATASPDPVGSWSGLLDVGTMQLRLRFNVTGEPGDLQATLDSPDQGAEGIPARIEVDGTHVVIRVPSIGGKFEGELGTDGESLVGTWSQGARGIPLSLGRGEVAAVSLPTAAIGDQPHGAELPGIWLGTLAVGVMELRLQFRVADTEGDLEVLMDSLDQDTHDIPCGAVLETERGVRFRIPSIGAEFVATLDAGGDTLRGEFRQAGQSFPLTVGRTTTKTVLNRPQEPVPPFPYTATDVIFPGGADDVALAGTLTMPPGDGPFPAAVLVSGSGPQDRNEELMGHKPFLVIADHLTRAGIAVLRYDDRGTAASTGEFSGATTADFAADASAAVAFLRDHPGIDAAAIGVIGHSEGGLVAPLVASTRDDLGYIVMLAGPGVKGREILLHQTDLMLRAGGEDEESVASEVEALAEALDVLDEFPDAAEARTEIVARLSARATEAGEEPETAAINALAGQLVGSWFRWFLEFDPAPTLGAVTCPVYAVWGGLDLQVDPSQNVAPVEKALEVGDSPRWETRVFDGLNHLFQPAETGAMGEYARIATTFAPEALEAIAAWVLESTGRN